MKNLTDRKQIFNELQLVVLGDEIWNKICSFVLKKDEFSEAEMIDFFKRISRLKSTPYQIENNLRNVAKMYYLKTNQDFFGAFPNILKIVEDLKNGFEPPNRGTKRTQGKNEDIVVPIHDTIDDEPKK